MAVGPRDTPHGRDTAAGFGDSRESRGSHEANGVPRPDLSPDDREDGDEPGDLEPLDPPEPLGSLDAHGPLDSLDSLEQADVVDHLDPLGAPDGLNGLDAVSLAGADDLLGPAGDGEPPDGGELMPPIGGGASFRELRPPRRLRFWQLAPITALAVGGSLMFAFPLAFESGDAGPVVAMLGLLLCLCAAGWGLMAARRVGQTWPGLPSRGSGERPDWRYVVGYTVLIGLLAVLAVWRVARLR